MPAPDSCHQQVVRALKKDGWEIEREQLPLEDTEDVPYLYVDILARKRNNGISRAIKTILIEVKCFQNPDNDTTELYKAVGQYLLYRTRVERIQLNIDLYLVIPQHVFQRIYTGAVAQMFWVFEVKFVVIGIVKEEVLRWT